MYEFRRRDLSVGGAVQGAFEQEQPYGEYFTLIYLFLQIVISENNVGLH